MGADLYIKDMDRKSQYTGFEVSERAVNLGYFRDCYNRWGLFALMSATLNREDISWWLTTDKKEFFRVDDEDGLIMTVEGVKKWGEEITPLLNQFIESSKVYSSNYNYKTGKRRRVKVRKVEDIEDIKSHAKLLLNFINLAIQEKSEIIWSV